ncbi:hypothetical protein H1R20_g2312, partial [Candolleomyces eurysporus]
MRLSAVVTTFLCFASTVIAVANPQPAPRSPNLRQVSRNQLEARAKYPEHFAPERRTNPSDVSDPCQENSPTPLRRELFGDQLLHPREAVAFLQGRGRFVSENGTEYVDNDFRALIERRAFRPSTLHNVYDTVKNQVGKVLMRISVPHYKKWKATLTPGKVYYLSPNTYIRHEDVDEIERILLADPSFVELEFHGLHLPRSFFEAAAAY